MTRTNFSLRSIATLPLCLAALASTPAASAQTSAALQFIPVIPCRVLDTRNANGTFGGPVMGAGSSRNVPVPQSGCGIPGTAQAYSLNVTVVPPAGLGFLSIWPAGQPQPVVSTLNSFDGRIVANAAIVPAGASGAVSLFVSSASHVVLDINGYFVPAATASSLAFYPVTPCRVADTRGNGFTGAFGAPALAAGATRNIPIPSSSCGIPATAAAYSLNMTVVPTASLGFLTTWPAGQGQPFVSTLNSLSGDIVANAAIVPAGTNGAVSVFATDATNLVVDINGYFAPPGAPGAQALFTVTPCRVADTRGNGFTGAFGAPALAAVSTRAFPIPSSACGIPASAAAYSMNVTVVPPAGLGFLTTWPVGQPQPTVSTLNSPQGKVLANAVLVPAGTNGAINVFVNNATEVILDINGYFGPAVGTSFVSGVTTQVASQTVGTAGGSITVGAGNALSGVKIDFPAGALGGNTTVRVSTNTGSLTPVSGTYPGTNLVIDVTGLTTFEQPVSVTIPFTGAADVVPVPYFVDANGRLRPAQLTSVNRAAGTFTFQTFHASIFTWILALLNPPNLTSSAFLPANDGFQVVNTGSTFNREGECFGMTAFALWYSIGSRRTLGNFFPKYLAAVGTDSNGATVRGQNVIATRAFTSITQKWTSYIPEVRRQINLTQPERYATIHNIIANTGEPVLIYLYRVNGAAGAHSVLAYEVNNNTRAISIYDPNIPGSVRTIQYSTANGAFNAYCNPACYDGIVYNGDGSLNLTEPFNNILLDAQNNFSNSAGATINISAPTNGQVLTTRFATLTGVINSSQLLVTRLTAIVGSVEYSTAVPVSGVFTLPIALLDGVNDIKFKTQGANANGALVTTSNNYDRLAYTLRASVPASIILMTLTWDRAVDLDTYVISPTGDYSSYFRPVMTDGGRLDRDDVDGFGPEHWTLLNTNTVRYNQPYRFRVHYYSGSVTTNYTVTIELYNGTSRQANFTYSGSLSTSNPSNDDPTDVGADWRDITTVTLTQAASPNDVPVVSSVDGKINITVPVASTEERRKAKP